MGRLPRPSTPSSPTCYIDEYILADLDNQKHEITPLRDQPLTDNWEWKQRPAGDGDLKVLEGEDGWTRTSVPTEVFRDLLNAGRIPDPFLDQNELDVQWVGEVDWAYRTAFTVDNGPGPGEQAVLVFEGLDTFASVYLNGRLILTSEVAARTHVIGLIPEEHVPRTSSRGYESSQERE